MLYYFLMNALPPISLKEPPEISFHELKEMLLLNLTAKDRQSLRLLFSPVDLYNIRALWLQRPLDARGNYEAKELEEILLTRDGLPSYLIDYLDRYETVRERLLHFSSLFSSLFKTFSEKSRGFLARYFQFERERTIVLTALRAKYLERDIGKELQFEDLADPLIAQILAQRDARDYNPPQEYENLKILFVEKRKDPEILNRACLEYCLETIEAMEEGASPYSIDQVLGYVARFLIVDRWFQLDQEKGRLEVEKLSGYG